jgi:hypothetical protein
MKFYINLKKWVYLLKKIIKLGLLNMPRKQACNQFRESLLAIKIQEASKSVKQHKI